MCLIFGEPMFEGSNVHSSYTFAKLNVQVCVTENLQGRHPFPNQTYIFQLDVRLGKVHLQIQMYI